jgi:hypothetical protein
MELEEPGKMLSPNNILIGAGLSFVISQLKRIPLVKQYPKVVSAILSTVIPATIGVYGQLKGTDVIPIQDLVAQAATIFATSIATHEAVTHPVNELVQQ